MPKIRLRAAMAAIAAISAIACLDRETATGLTRVDVPSGKVVGSSFFVAWDSAAYSNDPIVTQVNLNAAQYRQHFYSFYADSALKAFATANPGKLYIHGDEPDQYYNPCITPSAYAVLYHNFVDSVKKYDSTAKFSPAGFAEEMGLCSGGLHSINYASAFYSAYQSAYGIAPPVDEWRFHDFGHMYYVWETDTPLFSQWWLRVDSLAAWSVAHGANMVLGSWGFLSWNVPQSEFEGYMERAMDLLRNDGRINQAVWWSAHEWGTPHYLKNSNGSLTYEGVQYTQDPGVMSISLPANNKAQANQMCLYTVDIVGGISPYTYSWRINGAVQGTSSTLSYTNSGSSYTVSVTVSDTWGVARTASKSVTVGALPCLF